MLKQIKKVALVTNFNIYDKAKYATDVARVLIGEGCEIITSSYNRDKIEKICPGMAITYVQSEKLYRSCELVVVLGGDGTILESARRASPLEIPIIGINLGRVGYMAEIEVGEIESLKRIVSGDYEKEERSML